ncbi:tRNA 2-selenouridine(34) synthase MnmH [Cohnella pontilimi]|uniref:tRNA 2-selenouridine(34) synthase MnmH n=1 Tax=Cohnella pontilimi TaxID=2564100 RepID=A0A4U0FGC8_9BACL|nr:tRNA 2-selenouridine(34) synthase MnmH [Cohnella pontilimi]TJY43975.1 tRNA 2-selenouridine(34) synthase MnmH [Cohnella pontilimi]
MFQDISLEELIEQRKSGNFVLIDVRSPSEFEESSIPGSINIPLFNDEERAEVGTIYKQVSAQAAKERGLEIVSAKLPDFIRTFAEIPGRKAVFCWRGGMRSKTSATVLSLMDIHVYRLNGGYRAYRKWIMDSLENFHLRPKAVVLHGNTGTGKTLILRTLKERGLPVLDLEGMAGHRGSIFGQIGLKGNNQKTFEALLLEELLLCQHSPYVLMEAESKRIGKVVLPDFLVRKKEAGHHLMLELPLDVRVQHILDDYRPEEHHEECLAAFRHIKSRIHTPIAHEIEGCLMTARYDKAVKMLLEHYYDPRYAFSTDAYGADFTVVKASTIEEAVTNIEHIVQTLPL